MEAKKTIKNVVMLGAGSVATHLALALQMHGYHVSQVYSRTSDSAKILSQRTSSGFITDLQHLDTEADLYIIALKDSVVECLIKKLFVKGIVVHTSGTLPMNILENMSRHYGVFYPLQTFSRSRPIRFDHIPICLEASDNDTLEALQQVAATLSDKIYMMDSGQRQYIHLAAVFSCNFSNFMYVAAAEVLRDHQISFDILIPLIREFFDKVTMMDPWEAQTGPAIREDRSIIAKQLELLQDYPEFREIYRQITEKIIERKKLESKS